MENKEYDVVGFGSPLMDLIFEVQDEILEKMKLKKGTGILIDLKKF